MLEITRIRENKAAIVELFKVRNIEVEPKIDRILKVDETWRSNKQKLDSILAESNSIAKQIGQLFREGKQDEAAQAKAKGGELRVEEKQITETVNKLATELQQVFNTSSSSMFVVFGVGVPVYFLMSINRGVFQGKKEFKSLSITYQTEMLSRLFVTLALLLIFGIESPVIIALGIIISFVFGMFPFKSKLFSLQRNTRIRETYKKQIKTFFMLTAFYELTQIIINNSDILLVKHYFESYDAGLYASLALIGRMVYFIAWMFVMLLLPKVIHLKKEGKKTSCVLFKYIGYISFLSCIIITCCVLFPETIVQLLFGKSYIGIASLLWKYALATSMFAISNIFAYYYLSLDKYVPVIISGIFGLLQVVLIVWFHESLEQVVHVQILAMFLLLIVQILFYGAIVRIANKRVR